MEMLVERIVQRTALAVGQSKPRDIPALGPSEIETLSELTSQQLKIGIGGLLEELKQTGDVFNWNDAMLGMTLAVGCADIAKSVWVAFRNLKGVAA